MPGSVPHTTTTRVIARAQHNLVSRCLGTRPSNHAEVSASQGEKIPYFDTFFRYFSRFIAVDRDLLTFERIFLENSLFPVKEIFRVIGTPISLTISILYFTLDINFIP